MTEIVRRVTRGDISPQSRAGVQQISPMGSDIIRPGTRAPGFLGPTTVVSTPQVINITTYQGDDLYLYVVVWDHDGNPANLAHMTPRAQIRSAPADTSPDVMAVLNVAKSEEFHELEVWLTSAQSTRVTNPAVWDLQISDDIGRVITLCYGTFTILPEVTRP